MRRRSLSSGDLLQGLGELPLQVGFPVFSCDFPPLFLVIFERKTQNLPIFSCILIR